jgi:hypothetical protein
MSQFLISVQGVGSKDDPTRIAERFSNLDNCMESKLAN